MDPMQSFPPHILFSFWKVSFWRCINFANYFRFLYRYMKYLYPYECEKKNLSTPAELQAAIDGNRREGRRSSYGQFDSQMQGQLQMVSYKWILLEIVLTFIFRHSSSVHRAVCNRCHHYRWWRTAQMLPIPTTDWWACHPLATWPTSCPTITANECSNT